MYPSNSARPTVFFIAVATLLSWIFHEGGHWLAGTLLGYETHMTLNGTNIASGTMKPGAHLFWFDFGGPLVTYAAAIIAYSILQRQRSPRAYAVLLICTYMRCLAALLSIINPNDEARISKMAGIGAVTLPALVCIILIVLSASAARRRHFGTKSTLVILGWIMLFSSLLVLADMKWAPRIL